MASEPDEINAEGITVELPRNEILIGDAKEQLETLPDESVDMVMTSPPYWGLRDYGVDGQIGLETSVTAYITQLVGVFREVKRVLKPTGTVYLNIDDTYSGSNRGSWEPHSETINGEWSADKKPPAFQDDLPAKCMALVPERLIMALVEDGWILRNKIVWAKTNPMPESVKDRYSTTWEYVFMFSKEQQYYFDLDAVREPYKESSRKRVQQNNGNPKFDGDKQRGHPGGQEETLDPNQFVHTNGKNPGDVWELSTGQFPEAHFAVYPEELCRKPVKAGCPPKVCSACGQPYMRETEVEDVLDIGTARPQAERALEKFKESNLRREHIEAVRAVGCNDAGQAKITQNGAGKNADRIQQLAEEAKDVLGGYTREFLSPNQVTKGWGQQCDCEMNETQPGVVLDPFAGAGTTCLVAKKQRRDYIGIELNEEYAMLARERISEETKDARLTDFVDSYS